MTHQEFFENIIEDIKTHCWIWRPSLGKRGRPVVFQKDEHGVSRAINVAKIAYELFIAAVPVDMELHHSCVHEWCVRPTHLQPLTIAEHKLVHQQMPKRPARHATPQFTASPPTPSQAGEIQITRQPFDLASVAYIHQMEEIEGLASISCSCGEKFLNASIEYPEHLRERLDAAKRETV